MTRLALRSIVFMNISLFGGLCFAAAPVASVDVNSGMVQIQPTAPQNTSNTEPVTPPTPVQQNPTNTNTAVKHTTPPATTPVAKPAPPSVDSAALLASLSPEQRIARLENQVQYLSGYNTQLQNLSTEMDVLRGQVEDLNHQVYLLKKEAKQHNNTTASAVENMTTPSTDSTPEATQNTPTKESNATPSNTSATSANAKKAPTTPPPPAEEQTAFNKAYTLLVKQDYMEATTAFTNFLSKYPKSTLTPDAHYWLGDLYLAQGQPDNASQQYRAVVNVKDADKRPDAMAKLGTILLAYGDSAHAKQLFQQVVQEYPNSAAAKQAQTRLKSL